MHLKQQKGGNLIPSPRGASPNQSVETYTKFKARPFIEKNTFLVKKSLKILTVPESFNLNT